MPALLVDYTISPTDPSPLTYVVNGNTYPYVHQVDGVTRASDSRYAATLTKTNTALTFTAVVTSSGPAPIEYRWNFGDGTTLFGPVVAHTYIVAVSQMAVSLVVTDQNLTQYTRQKLLSLREGQRVLFGYPFRVTG